ncbi:MAG: hypothetical protein IT374_26355 [Polyangiaceae bacterium]|nr:hypothetical protein [Polyangiaceae bacterium]
MTAARARASALERAADEDDAHDDAKATADDLAARMVGDLETLAREPGVTAETADQFADAYCALVTLAAMTAARPILPGLTERAHGGISPTEARRLERIPRTAVDEHRTQRRVAREQARRGEGGTS